MSDPAATPGPHARFPYGPALLCAACVSMAAWTWMRYSAVRHLTLDRVCRMNPSTLALLEQAYVCVSTGSAEVSYELENHAFPGMERQRTGCAMVLGWVRRDGRYPLWVGLFMASSGREEAIIREARSLVVWQGRVPLAGEGLVKFRGTRGAWQGDLVVDMTASRFHPASVAGLVVAAFGAFVFALYLKRWLVEKSSEGAPATPPGA